MGVKVEVTRDMPRNKIHPNLGLVRPSLSGNFLGKVGTYGDALDLLNIPPARYSDHVLKTRYSFLLDKLKNTNALALPGDDRRQRLVPRIETEMTGAFSATRRLSMSKLLALSDPILMTPRMKIGQIGGAFVSNNTLFALTTPLDMYLYEYLPYKSIALSKQIEMQALNIAFASGYTTISCLGESMLLIPKKSASTLAFGGFILGGIKTSPEELLPISLISGMIGQAAFVGTSAVSTRIASKILKSMNGRKALVVGGISFLAGDLAGKFTNEALILVNSSETGNALINCPFVRGASELSLSFLDWAWMTYSFNGSISPSKFSRIGMLAKKAPVVGTAIQMLGATLGSYQLLFSGDVWTTTMGVYNIAKEGAITYASSTAAISGGVASAETGPGAFVAGAAVYVVIDQYLRKMLKKAEDKTDLHGFFEKKMIMEPLADIGIGLRIKRPGYRPYALTKHQRTVPVEFIRMYLAGDEQYGDMRRNGEMFRYDVQKELRASGIKSISVENIKDIDVSMLYKIAQAVKEMGGAKTGDYHVNISFKNILQTYEGEKAIYTVTIIRSGNRKMEVKILPFMTAMGPEKGYDLLSVIKGKDKDNLPVDLLILDGKPAMLQMVTALMSAGYFEGQKRTQALKILKDVVRDGSYDYFRTAMNHALLREVLCAHIKQAVATMQKKNFDDVEYISKKELLELYNAYLIERSGKQDAAKLDAELNEAL
jgi:hypothetical protein